VFEEVVYDEYHNRSDKTVLINTRFGYINIMPRAKFNTIPIRYVPKENMAGRAEEVAAEHKRSMRVSGSYGGRDLTMPVVTDPSLMSR
jgi:hypothetical protein